MPSSFQTRSPFVAPQVPDVVKKALAAAPQKPGERPWATMPSLPPTTPDEAEAEIAEAELRVRACELLLASPGITHEQRTNALNALPDYRGLLSRAKVALAALTAAETPTEGDAA